MRSCAEPKVSVILEFTNTSFGNPPPKLGRIAGFFFVVSLMNRGPFYPWTIGIKPIACITPRSAGVTVTLRNPPFRDVEPKLEGYHPLRFQDYKPQLTSCLCSSRYCVNRSFGNSGCESQDFKTIPSKHCSAGVRFFSPQSCSTLGPSSPPSTSQSASAILTEFVEFSGATRI